MTTTPAEIRAVLAEMRAGMVALESSLLAAMPKGGPDLAARSSALATEEARRAAAGVRVSVANSIDGRRAELMSDTAAHQTEAIRATYGALQSALVIAAQGMAVLGALADRIEAEETQATAARAEAERVAAEAERARPATINFWQR